MPRYNRAIFEARMGLIKRGMWSKSGKLGVTEVLVRWHAF